MDPGPSASHRRAALRRGRSDRHRSGMPLAEARRDGVLHRRSECAWRRAKRRCRRPPGDRGAVRACAARRRRVARRCSAEAAHEADWLVLRTVRRSPSASTSSHIDARRDAKRVLQVDDDQVGRPSATHRLCRSPAKRQRYGDRPPVRRVTDEEPTRVAVHRARRPPRWAGRRSAAQCGRCRPRSRSSRCAGAGRRGARRRAAPLYGELRLLPRFPVRAATFPAPQSGPRVDTIPSPSPEANGPPESGGGVGGGRVRPPASRGWRWSCCRHLPRLDDAASRTRRGLIHRASRGRATIARDQKRQRALGGTRFARAATVRIARRCGRQGGRSMASRVPSETTPSPQMATRLVDRLRPTPRSPSIAALSIAPRRAFAGERLETPARRRRRPRWPRRRRCDALGRHGIGPAARHGILARLGDRPGIRPSVDLRSAARARIEPPRAADARQSCPASSGGHGCASSPHRTEASVGGSRTSQIAPQACQPRQR